MFDTDQKITKFQLQLEVYIIVHHYVIRHPSFLKVKGHSFNMNLIANPDSSNDYSLKSRSFELFLKKKRGGGNKQVGRRLGEGREEREKRKPGRDGNQTKEILFLQIHSISVSLSLDHWPFYNKGYKIC